MMILLWGTLLAVFVVLLPSNNVAVVSGEPSYNYASPSPPPPPYSSKWLSPSPPLSYEHNSLHTTPPPHHDLRPIVKVAGMVYCYKCYNWNHPATSHHKKLLKGAVVKVTCKAGYNHYVGYGKTKSNGKYIITIEGYPYQNYGAEGCKVRLQAAPKGSMCNIPTDLNQDVVPKVYSKSNHVVLLKAKFLAFSSRMSYKCKTPPPAAVSSLSPYYYKSPPPYYYYNSPPPPSPSPPSSYYYKFPPPPSPSSPTPYYKSPPPPSSPPPPRYYYKSPPPPYSSPPPIYHYNSPPPPSPSPKSPYHYPSPSPYHYNAPPLPSPSPSPSPPPPYYYTSPPPPSPSPPPPYLYISPAPPNYLYSSPPPPSHY